MPFWQFFRKGPQKLIITFEKLFLFWVPMNIEKDWKAKLESAYSFMLKYSKITVWRWFKMRHGVLKIEPKWKYLLRLIHLYLPPEFVTVLCGKKRASQTTATTETETRNSKKRNSKKKNIPEATSIKGTTLTPCITRISLARNFKRFQCAYASSNTYYETESPPLTRISLHVVLPESTTNTNIA